LKVSILSFDTNTFSFITSILHVCLVDTEALAFSRFYNFALIVSLILRVDFQPPLFRSGHFEAESAEMATPLL